MRQKKSLTVLAFILLTLPACAPSEKKIAEQLLALKAAHQAWLEEAAATYISLRDQGRQAEADSLAFHVREIDDRLRTLEIEAASAFLSYVKTKRSEDRMTVLAKISQIVALLQGIKGGS